MSVITVPVAGPGDDGILSSGGSTTLNATTLPANSALQEPIFRFPLAIPPGSTINSATVTLTRISSTKNASGTWTWRAFALDTVPNLSGASGYARSTATGTGSYSTGSDGTKVTHTVTGPVAEAVGRSGWAAGNYLGLVATIASPGSSGSVAAYDYGNASYYPTLTVDYTEPVVTGPAEAGTFYLYPQGATPARDFSIANYTMGHGYRISGSGKWHRGWRVYLDPSYGDGTVLRIWDGVTQQNLAAVAVTPGVEAANWYTVGSVAPFEYVANRLYVATIHHPTAAVYYGGTGGPPAGSGPIGSVSSLFLGGADGYPTSQNDVYLWNVSPLVGDDPALDVPSGPESGRFLLAVA